MDPFKGWRECLHTDLPFGQIFELLMAIETQFEGTFRQRLLDVSRLLSIADRCHCEMNGGGTRPTIRELIREPFEGAFVAFCLTQPCEIAVID